MKKIETIFLKISIVFFVLTITLYAITDLDKYQIAKKNYITAIFKNDKTKEEKYLKELILYGKKSKQDISKYQSELYRLGKKSKSSTNIKIDKADANSYKQQDENILENIPTRLLSDKNQLIKGDIEYNIKKITAKESTIIVDFNKKISKDDIEFTKSMQKDGVQYLFKLKGNYQDVESSKISVDGIDAISLDQEKDNLFSISILNQSDTKTYYIVLEKRLIIKNSVIEPQKKRDEEGKNKFLESDTNDQSNILTLPFETRKTNSGKAKVIVIDAGHGGKDSGAVGPNNEYEKDVTLNIAKYLQLNLKSLGYEVYLTRNNDTYIALKDRTRIANKNNADLFVSIHANATVKDRANYAKGIETYFLSPARSERAKGVAALENKEDMDAMDSFNDQDLVLTLLNRSKTVQSQKFAIDIQSHVLYQVRKNYGKNMIDNGVREAPFWVLVGAQMPAVLIEVGYISHPDESKILMRDDYQQDVAIGISEGITAYFIHNR